MSTDLGVSSDLADVVRDQKAIYIISDATAETAERVLRAALIQFKGVAPEIRIFSLLRKDELIDEALKQAALARALVIYTMVNPAQRARLEGKAKLYQLETVDLIGQLMGRLTQFLGAEPTGNPGLPSLNKDYFDRIEAVEFAVKHDDGQAAKGLKDADLILVGLSRTSKTPLSTYLAQKGLKAANVPIVLGLPLPHELDLVDQHKVFGLTINIGALIRIRRERLKALNMPVDTDYARRDHIVRELQYGRQIFAAHPQWPVVDVSERAIEETAAILLRIREQRLRDDKRDAAEASEAG
ncbi:MAG: regulator of PEP synthase PpsR (kinase-PPPase family) [Myxococcota bacterium]|jgi:regulator of PEP synthase PpsR (kinase-PPPase family)